MLYDLEQEMRRLGYAEKTLCGYKWRWHGLLQFAEACGDIFYSEQLGIDFLKHHYNLPAKDSDHVFSEYETLTLHIVRMIGDFQLHHSILRRYGTKQKKLLTDPYYVAISTQFESYCADQGYSKITIGNYINLSARFMDFLVSQQITSCCKIKLPLIHAYIKTLLGYSHHSIELHITSIRAFFRFLLDTGKIQTDFASKISMIKTRKQLRIPSVWTENELKKLIGVIDRRSPMGKRDYAIILLACCLGIRCTDIKKLKPENFHWEEKKLVFIQSKTKIPLSLPLIPEVGWAVIDYLKHGRPKINNPCIFVKHIAPYDSISETDTLYRTIKRHMKLAGFPPCNKKRGMHSLRHTMASMMLEKNTPLYTISDMLGHVDTNSTALYLKVDIKKLRECSLDFWESNDE